MTAVGTVLLTGRGASEQRTIVGSRRGLGSVLDTAGRCADKLCGAGFKAVAIKIEGT